MEANEATSAQKSANAKRDFSFLHEGFVKCDAAIRKTVVLVVAFDACATAHARG